VTVVINGMEYAESNYPNYWWFWNYPLLLLFQDTAPSHYGTGVIIPDTLRKEFLVGGQGLITYGEIAKWLEFDRCPCGVGYSPRKVDPTAPVGRWLCATCGRGEGTLVKWIGRRTANRWEWKRESELPVDLTPMGRLAHDSDFDARVKAAVEVEVAERMASMERK
jgi:hypothetical protein